MVYSPPKSCKSRHWALRHNSSKADCFLQQVILVKALTKSSNMWSAIARLCLAPPLGVALGRCDRKGNKNHWQAVERARELSSGRPTSDHHASEPQANQSQQTLSPCETSHTRKTASSKSDRPYGVHATLMVPEEGYARHLVVQVGSGRANFT